MSDIDDDLESPEDDQTPEAGANGGPTLADLKKLRSENRGLRDRLRKAEDEALTTRFGAELVDLLPEEVTDHERRVALAEKLQARLQASGTAQTDQAPQTGSQEGPTEDEKALAAVSDGPSAAGAAGKVYSAEEIRQIGVSNPSEAFRILQAQVDPATGQLRTE